MGKSIVFTAAILLALAAPAIAETPTLKMFNLWLTAVNSRDSGKITEFWQKNGRDSASERADHDMNLVSMTGGFTLVNVIKDDGAHLEVLLKEGRGTYSELTIDLDQADPPTIRGIFGHPVPGPGPAKPSAKASAALADPELAALVQAHATDPAAKEPFSGVILIAHGGKPVLDRAWGMADSEKGVQNTVDTQFCLGSMNKMFTAIATLQLVQQGKLSLDAHLRDYWPDYPNHDLAARVTIRQLLSHTAGTGDFFTPEYEARRTETRTLADYVKLFGNRPVAFEPGSHMEYSNYGFILLGRLVELVSQQSYNDYVLQHIFAPAGMSHTDSRPESDHIAGRAIGYTRGPSGLQPNTPGLPWSGTSAGGGYSTVGDLLLFANALQSGKLLSPALLSQATADQSHAGYGFGFYVFEDGSFGHGGGGPGINAEMRIVPKQSYVIVVLANRDPHLATDTERFIEGLLSKT